MKTVTINLPDSVHAAIFRLAAEGNVSVEDFLQAAAQEKLSAIEASVLFGTRRGTVTREEFMRAISIGPDAPPLPGDELPEGYRKAE